MLDPWYERNPERLERELQAFRDFGFAPELSEQARGDRQVIEVHLTVPFGEEDTLDLRVAYPDLYPYFRPKVFTEDLSLDRHQHPFRGNLCLIDRPTDQWKPEKTAAEHIEEQLPETVEKGRVTDPDAIAADDAEHAEPFSDYYPYPEGSQILIESSFEIDPGLCQEGGMTIGLKRNSSVRLRGALKEVRDGSGNTFHHLPQEVANKFPRTVEGRWFYFDEAPPKENPNDALQWIDQKVGLPPREESFEIEGGTLQDVIGIAFPEEIAPGKQGTGWVFIVRVKVSKQLTQNGSTFSIPQDEAVYVPAGRVGKNDLQERIPELAPLRDETISVIGLGSLGAPSAIEFARSGVSKLHVLDHDTVDPPTTVRWPLGIPASGLPKASVLGNFIEEHFPYTVVERSDFKIGEIRMTRSQSSSGSNPAPEWERIRPVVEDTSLVFDATAEEGVNQYLAALCREKEVPYVFISGTLGAWGGIVGRVIPDQTEGCWMCLKYALDPNYEGDIPYPSMDESGEIRPQGCGDPTFTGAGFDLSNLSMMGVRLAVATLCSDASNGYPDFDWDVGILNLRDPDGIPVAPDWSTYPLPAHPSCPNCHQKR